MTCRFYQCDKTADYPFPCCGIDHGKKFKQNRELAQSYKRGDMLTWGQTLWERLSKDEQDYYLKLV